MDTDSAAARIKALERALVTIRSAYDSGIGIFRFHPEAFVEDPWQWVDDVIATVLPEENFRRIVAEMEAEGLGD